MAKMSEGFVNTLSGKDAFQRQLTLFSICGIIGLFQSYILIENAGVMYRYILAIISILFTFFLTGYEIIFMKEQELPDADVRSFKIMSNKIPLLVFFVCIPLTLASIFTKYQNLAFCIEAILAVPLTMMQAGFSYNFSDRDWNILFKVFKFGDYISLFFKRMWIIILAYAVTFTTIFCTFFVIGFIIALLHRGDLSGIKFLLTSKEYAIKAISTYMTGVLMIYTLTIGTLVWDYELIKTYEREVE